MTAKSLDSKFGINKESIAVGTTFQKFMLGLVIVSTLISAGVHFYMAPKTFTIDDKHWDCTATEPNGIEARCTNFTMKKYALRTQ